MIKSKNTLAILLLVGLIIFFETAQQLFYIERFQLAEGVTFWELFIRQAYRWIIWFILAVTMVFLVKKFPFKAYKTAASTLIIFLYVCFNIVVISILSFIEGGPPYQVKLFFQEYLLFFIFQKAPIFTLAYISVWWIIQLKETNKQLASEVTTISEIATTNQQLYQELKTQYENPETILTIKSGDKYQIVNLEEIEYIEADDYCVNIYLHHGKRFVMRHSLKRLENKLPPNFVRIHRKFIINQNFTNHLNLNTRLVVLNSKTQLPIAKSKLKTVKRFFSFEGSL